MSRIKKISPSVPVKKLFGIVGTLLAYIRELPDREGKWLRIYSRTIVDVYRLEPVLGEPLCIWGPDIGIDYSGVGETQEIWDTDEWQGHIRVECLSDGPWIFLGEEGWHGFD